MYGVKCVVYTDNIALKSLLSAPHPSGKLARWGLALQELDLDIRHRSGKENQHADALSREPLQSNDTELFCEQDNEQTVYNNNSVPNHVLLNFVGSDSLRERQKEDPELKLYFDYLEDGTLPGDEKIARRIVLERDHFHVEEGILCRQDNDGRLKLIPPNSMREQLFHDLHDGEFAGHLGVGKTVGRALTHYWWPGMRQFIKKRCSQCLTCGSRRSGGATTVPLTPIPVGVPFEMLGVDVLKLPKTHSGKQYAVIFMDYLTKWPEVFATSNQEALTIAKLLAEHIVPCHGVPSIFYCT